MRDPFKLVNDFLGDSLLTFRAFQIVIAAVCILIPFLLRISDKDTKYPYRPQFARAEFIKIKSCGPNRDTSSEIEKDKWQFRTSLSEYVYSSNSYIFGMLFTTAAMLFIFNGAVYFRYENHLTTNTKGKWYNVILGLSLIGVVLVPDEYSCFWHVTFAVLFFLGNILVIVFAHQDKNKIISIVLAGVALLSIVLGVWLDFFSILFAEWISLTAIATHLIIEAFSTDYKYGYGPKKSLTAPGNNIVG